MNKQYEALEMIKEFLNSVITNKEDLSYKNPETAGIDRLKNIENSMRQILNNLVDMNVFKIKSSINNQLADLFEEVSDITPDMRTCVRSTEVINHIDKINKKAIKNLKIVDLLLATVRSEATPNRYKI